MRTLRLFRGGVREELALRGDESVPGHGRGWGGSKQPEAGGDGDETADDGDDADALNPQCAVEIGADGGTERVKIGFRGEFITVDSGRPAALSTSKVLALLVLPPAQSSSPNRRCSGSTA